MTVTATAVQTELEQWRQAERHALALIKEFAPNSIIGVNGYSLPRWTDTLSEMERKELSAGKRSGLAQEAALKLLGHKTVNRQLDQSPAAVQAAKRQFDLWTI